MSENFNGLTPAETERLALVAEECAEVVQVIGKILRHGYESSSPFDPERVTNRQNLEVEVGQLLYALALATTAGDISTRGVAFGRTNKAQTVGNWLHHQTDPMLAAVKNALIKTEEDRQT
jgi:hypothetical protein